MPGLILAHEHRFFWTGMRVSITTSPDTHLRAILATASGELREDDAKGAGTTEAKSLADHGPPYPQAPG